MTGQPLDLVGEVLGAQFRVDAFVGEGILSVVYRGRHTDLGVPVAIKCLHLPPALEPTVAWPVVESFLEGGRVHQDLARGNVHIAQTLASGTVVAPKSGLTVQYYVRQWLDGEPLAQDLARRRQEGRGGRTVPEAMALLEGAAEGLAYAHSRQRPHLALRPANIFLAREDGEVSSTVLDFGIGRAVDVAEVAVRGARGLPAMSNGYLAPEHVRRGRGELSPRTDVYVLALILLEVLTDRELTVATTMDEAIERAIDPEARPSPWVDRRLPVPVARVLERALSVHPLRRFAHAAELWAALEGAARVARVLRLPASAARPRREALLRRLGEWKIAPRRAERGGELTPIAPRVGVPAAALPPMRDLLPTLEGPDDQWAEQTAKWDVLAVIERAGSLDEPVRHDQLAALLLRTCRRPPRAGLARAVRRRSTSGAPPQPPLAPPPPQPLPFMAPPVSPAVPQAPSPVSRPAPASGGAPASGPVSRPEPGPISAPPTSGPASGPAPSAGPPTSGAPVSAAVPTPPMPIPALPLTAAERPPSGRWRGLALLLGVALAGGALAGVLFAARRDPPPPPAPSAAATSATSAHEAPSSSAQAPPPAAGSSAPVPDPAPSARPAPVRFRLSNARRALDQRAAELGACRTPGGLWGSGDAVVAFGAEGRPTEVVLGSPYKGDPTGDCVIRKLMSADMGPFIGGNQRLIYSFKVPQTAAP